MKFLTIALLLSLSLTTYAANDIDEKVKAAQAAESRPEADRDRDRNRRPLRTLNFFGLKDDMRVLELIPGGGWYTRILAPVLADNGKLYVAIGAGRVEENIIGTPGFENVEALQTTADDYDFGVDNLDMVLTFRNLHNISAEARATMNREVFKALKSGGRYGVIDHTRRHMEKLDNENGRRVDPVLVIKEMLDVGFEFVDYSDLHFRADDELEYEVGRHSVTGNTDRFTLLFRKP
jgi:predicted methyltransferase